jgi:4-hydroxy-3-methylbut-2-enyl diphosphate reductase
METKILKPYGYCLGVVKAIQLSKKVKENYPNNDIYIFGHLVHNELVTKELEKLGIKSLDIKDPFKVLNSFKKDDIVIFTAHGHDEKYETVLKEKGIQFFDATCSKVKDNEKLIRENLDAGVIYIGVKGHEETNAALSISNSIVLYDIKDGIDFNKLNVSSPLIVNQTTLSLLEIKDIYEDIKNHLPNARFQDEICNATRMRQVNLINDNNHYDLIVIVGSETSSNTNKLYLMGKASHPNSLVVKVNDVEKLKKYDLSSCHSALVGSGTSTPLKVIEEVIKYLEEL